MIVSPFGKALDVPDGDHRDGARIQIYDRNGDANQRFVLRPARERPPGELLRGPLGRPPQNFGAERVVRCSSDDGHRNNCAVDTAGGVRMLRQISGSRCIEGDTWGWDRRGIWVDRGCRAEFDVGGGRGPGRPVAPPGRRDDSTGSYRVACASDDGRRNYCRAETAGGVRMARQISGSPCRQGETWGWDRGGIWVDRGCRAEFEVSRR
jgi:hypothetical protein